MGIEAAGRGYRAVCRHPRAEAFLAGAEPQPVPPLRLPWGDIDALPAALIATGASGEVVCWNRQAEQLYGWSRDEVLGRLIVDLLVGPADAGVAGQIMAAVGGGVVWEGDFRVRRRDGAELMVRVADVPVLDPGGSVGGIVGLSAVSGSLPPSTWRKLVGDLSAA